MLNVLLGALQTVVIALVIGPGLAGKAAFTVVALDDPLHPLKSVTVTLLTPGSVTLIVCVVWLFDHT
jgi:hypothetical protein